VEFESRRGRETPKRSSSGRRLIHKRTKWAEPRPNQWDKTFWGLVQTTHGDGSKQKFVLFRSWFRKPYFFTDFFITAVLGSHGNLKTWSWNWSASSRVRSLKYDLPPVNLASVKHLRRRNKMATIFTAGCKINVDRCAGVCVYQNRVLIMALLIQEV